MRCTPAAASKPFLFPVLTAPRLPNPDPWLRPPHCQGDSPTALLQPLLLCNCDLPTKRVTDWRRQAAQGSMRRLLRLAAARQRGGSAAAQLCRPAPAGTPAAVLSGAPDQRAGFCKRLKRRGRGPGRSREPPRTRRASWYFCVELTGSSTSPQHARSPCRPPSLPSARPPPRSPLSHLSQLICAVSIRS